jgi:hypothetical protein
VFAGDGGPDRPAMVSRVGLGDVDRVDRRVGQQRRIAVVHDRDAVPVRVLLGADRVARRDRCDADALLEQGAFGERGSSDQADLERHRSSPVSVGSYFKV